jgi:hypothetical protein
LVPAPRWGVLPAEGVVAVAALISLGLVAWLRTPDPPEPEAPAPPPPPRRFDEAAPPDPTPERLEDSRFSGG